MSVGTFPVAKFYFTVEVNGQSIRCHEVTGLEQESEILEYRFGSSVSFVTMKRQGLLKTSRLVIKKAVFSGDNMLAEIWNESDNKGYNSHSNNVMNLLVRLLDENGETVMSWKVNAAVPCKFSGGDYQAQTNEVSMETIEFVHEGIQPEF